jgi:hypothetical protein
VLPQRLDKLDTAKSVLMRLHNKSAGLTVGQQFDVLYRESAGLTVGKQVDVLYRESGGLTVGQQVDILYIGKCRIDCRLAG